MNFSMNLDIIPKLDITMYPNYQIFPALIEVGRGCPFSCDFCSSTKRILKKKPINDIIEEAETIASNYNSDSISIYFEAPILQMADSEIAELIRLRKEHGLNFTWRAETRVEYLIPRRIQALFEAGMRVVDIGLESGSPELLKKMNKTLECAKYLNRITFNSGNMPPDRNYYKNQSTFLFGRKRSYTR